MDEYIWFNSSIKDLKVDNKLIVDSEKDVLKILKYYREIQTQINKKISVFLEELIDIKTLKNEISHIFQLNEDDFIKQINSRDIKQRINLLLNNFDNDIKKSLYNCCKVYLIENYFFNKKMSISFHKL